MFFVPGRWHKRNQIFALCNLFLQTSWKTFPKVAQKHPRSSLPHLRWYVYSEIMTYCAERSWKWSDDMALLVQARFPEPVSTLGADEVFRHMRKAKAQTEVEEQAASPEPSAAPQHLPCLFCRELAFQEECHESTTWQYYPFSRLSHLVYFTTMKPQSRKFLRSLVRSWFEILRGCQNPDSE